MAQTHRSTAVEYTSKDNTDNDGPSKANCIGEKMMADEESSNADGTNDS